MVENDENMRGRVMDLRVEVEFGMVDRDKKSHGEGGG